ncbi:hypothetical protein SAMN05444162_1253 [Paenibacillaceae bacterium GAS479]|nr:hypothetical protein SAMN05444162_1253 [Paenibacillaceae bacterium GAS479]
MVSSFVLHLYLLNKRNEAVEAEGSIALDKPYSISKTAH